MGQQGDESVLSHVFRIFILLCAVAVAGCTNVSYDFAESVLPLAAPRFADNDPVDRFDGGAPHG